MEYYNFSCNSCGANWNSGYLDKKCGECGSKDLRYISYEEFTDPRDILIAIESELENANYHSMTSLPEKIYASVEKMAYPSEKAKLARAIADAFYGAI